MLARAAAVVAVVLMGSAVALADATRENLQILKDIQDQVNRYAYFTIFDDVNASFEEDGVIVLTGSVTMPFKRDEIAERVARVDGVTEVENAIQVLPLSQFDNQLRFRVARAIYGHSGFQHYSRRHPPVHIVVEHGHVTLTGVVNNDVDRALARSLAHQFGAFSVTNELKTTDQARDELELLD